MLTTLALPVAACGDDSTGDTSSTTEPAAAAGDSTTTVAGEDAGPRTVEHAMGSTEVPGDPQRVVVLDSSFLDAAVALGVKPVAATEAQAGEGVSPYLEDELGDVEIVGLITDPNLESVAAARPDLILGAKVRHEALYDQLSQIAPTVFTESSGTNWRKGLKVTADALNRSDRAEELLADFEARAEEIGEKVGAGGKTASIVRFLPGEIRLYGPETFSGSVLTAVGFDLGDKGFDANPYSMAMLSAEQISMADADVVFATTYGDRSSTDFATVEAVWNALPAVAEGRQHDVDDREWMLGIGLIGANIILDDLESLLAS